MVELIDSHRSKYETIYSDIEGYAGATYNGIIEDVNRLSNTKSET